MIIAIDGPSGAGKSSVAKEVARKLGFSCLDTGAMYRAVAWKCLQLGVSLENNEDMGKVARENAIDFAHEGGNPIPTKVFIQGEEVTSLIRTAEMDKAVTPVSAAPQVRTALLDQQRRIGNSGNYVVEGRDIGTVVFPQAELKIFLTASFEERARRRVKQNEKRGVGSCDYEEVLADLKRRDEADSTRTTAPLKAAEDAYNLDSTDIPFNDVVAIICDMVQKTPKK